MIKNKKHRTQCVYKWERHGHIFNQEKEKKRQLRGTPPALGAAILPVILALRVGLKSRVQNGFQAVAALFDSGQTGFESQSSSLLGSGN